MPRLQPWDEDRLTALVHIDGGWRDHRLFAITIEQCPGGLLKRWNGRAGSETW